MATQQNSHHSSQLNWKIGAPAGFGVMTTGLLMAKLAARAGAQVITYPEYPSLIQGGHNTYELTASLRSHPYATKRQIDVLVCLNPETYLLHLKRLNENSLILFDPITKIEVTTGSPIPVPLTEIQTSQKADKIMINTIALGASAGILGIDKQILTDLIHEQFSGKKNSQVAKINVDCALAGFEYVRQNFATQLRPFFAKQAAKETDQNDNNDLSINKNISAEKFDNTKLVMTGNEAFSLAAVNAHCQFYGAYPMTPTSTVLGILAGWQQETGMIVRHSEDEIAVINSALGASFAGVRSAVGTSGGGFALMVETVSLAGVTETPLVILMGQRPGPATGMPTWTEQGDLLFTVHAGHGEFQKIVLAPGDLEETLALTQKAFDLADIYQLPVIILTDKFLAESHSSIQESLVKKLLEHQPQRGKLLTKWHNDKPYLRYEITSDGISPRLIPGTPNTFYQANSYEHLEDTHTSESASERIKQVDKRAQKITTYIKNDFSAPLLFTANSNKKTQLTLVGWGSSKNPVLAAQQALLQENIYINYLHFTHLYPLSSDVVLPFFQEDMRHYLLIENNATAQFGQLLRQQTGVHLTQQLLKYNGRPLFQEEIIQKVKEILK